MKWTIFALLTLFTLINPTTIAWASDAITVVQYPLINRPALVLPGATFTIECKTGSSVSDWQAKLSMPYKGLALDVAAGEYVDGVRTLSAAVPTDAPYELYDLEIIASQGVSDVVRQCVRILPEYKDTFTFVHLPDCHLPAVSWIGFYDDPNSVSELRQVIQEINLINPEFVLQTGDLVDDGQDESQYQLAQELLEECEVPLFITGGNHDLWYDGHSLWHRYFGETMDYSFRYGPIRFVGMEMYDTPTKTYTPDQMNWLRAELEGSISAGEGSRVIFTHYDESYQLTGDFVDEHEIDAIFYGHTHMNAEERIGLRQALKLNTSYTMNENGEYTLVKVSDGRITQYPLLKFRHLWVNISPNNDGSCWKLQADIHNNLVNFRQGTNEGVDLEDVLVKLHVRRDAAPFSVVGGDVLQYIDYDTNKRVYYVTTDVPARSAVQVAVVGSGYSNEPPVISYYSPRYDTTVYAGQTLRFGIVAQDVDGSNLAYTWRKNGEVVSGESEPVYEYQPAVHYEGKVEVSVEVSDGTYADTKSWSVYVEESSGRPQPVSDTRKFFAYDQEATIAWLEPLPGDGVLEYGLAPGRYTGIIHEEGNTNEVRFIPQNEGMGLGIYYCRIRVDELSSNEFHIVIEATQAPNAVSPIGNITTLSPIFQWEPVQGVPYYSILVSEEEIVVTEDPVTGGFSIEGVNYIWALVTPDRNAPYGSPDPSGTFTNFPAPLSAGGDYWWAVLNCYGNTPELTSAVQSGVSHFYVDIAPPDLGAPTLLSPDPDVSLSGPSIVFRWSSVPNAVGYHFYPYKIEVEEGVNVVRPIWETVQTTTNTVLEYDAAALLMKGDYQWKVAAVAENGIEVPSEPRGFSYDAPAATLNLQTFDSRGTADIGDDLFLPRVTVSYDAIAGVDMGLPLSTDLEGKRSNILFAPGTYVFRASKECFAPFQDTLTFVDGQTVDAQFRLVPDPSTLAGTLVDQTGLPVAAGMVNAQHSLHSEILRHTNSNQNGEFSVSLIPGPWLISGAKQGYQPCPQRSVNVRAGEVKELSPPLILIRNENTVSGRVINTAGLAVYGATVTIARGEDNQEASTDANGTFSFQVYDGTWHIDVRKSGFSSPPSRQISVSGGVLYDVSPDLELTPLASLITGTVSDGLTAVGGATVRAVPSSGGVVTAVSDAYGQYTLTLGAGYYSVTATKEGYSPGEPRELSLSPGETVSGVELTLIPNAGTVSGSVTVDGFTPLPGVTVHADGRTVLTDDGGRYQVEVSSGTHEILAEKEGYLGGAAKSVTVAPGQNVEGVNFDLTPNASVIRGRVVCAGGVAGAVVKVDEDATTKTVTDDAGYYTLSVEAGEYNLFAKKAGFVSDTISVLVGQAQVLVGKNITLRRNIATVSGRITITPTSDPMAGASVVIVNEGVSTTSKQDGSYQLEVEPSEGGYQMTASKEGYHSQTLSTGPLSVGSNVSIDFSLALISTRLAGTIYDEAGDRIVSAFVCAVAGTDTFGTTSQADGGYLLGLPPNGGTFAVSAQKEGYRFAEGAVTLTFSSGEEKILDITLHAYFAGLRGSVYNVENGGHVSQAILNLTSSQGLAASTTSNEAGQYEFVNSEGDPFLTEGIYDLQAGKTGFADTVVVGVSLLGNQTIIQDVGLRKHDGWLDGVVTDGATPLGNVTVIADNVQSCERFSDVTNEAGRFRLTPIPRGEYSLQVSRSGYTSYGDTLVQAPQSDILLTLAKNVGRFWGTVTDAETGLGIGGTSVAVSDGQGDEARVSSAGDGRYDISSLPTLYPYDISVARGGYYSESRENVLATEPGPIDFQLRRIYGSVSGGVFLTDGSAVPDVPVLAQTGATSFLDTTDENGHYSMARLPTGLYYVSVEKAGHITTPGYHTVGVYSDGGISGIDFQLEAVSVANIDISGPPTISNNSTGSYAFTATTEDGRSVPIVPQWSISFPEAIDSITSTGVLYPRNDFVGPLWVVLTDAYSGYRDSLQIQVVANISPGDDEKLLQDYRGGTFLFTPDCLVQPIAFGLQYLKIPDAKRLIARYEVVGNTYAFQPAYLTLAEPMTLTLPIPKSASTGSEVFRWDRSRLAWELVEGMEVEDGVQVMADQLAQWAVMTPSQPLGIRDFAVSPNPFSPFTGPLSISFRLSSQTSTHLFVTIKIYNMVGDLVRELVVEKGITKGERQEIPWDGTTDSGELALNGRYLLFMEVKDGEDTEKILKPIVLIK